MTVNITLGSTQRNPEDEPVYIRLLTERLVEGILWARPSAEPDDRHLLALLETGVPVAMAAYHLPTETLTVLDVDNVDGAQQATNCLLERGNHHSDQPSVQYADSPPAVTGR